MTTHAPRPGGSMVRPFDKAPLCYNAPADDDTGCRGDYDWPEGDVTSSGVVTCEYCIAILCEQTQYYNLLRARGLRSFDESIEWPP